MDIAYSVNGLPIRLTYERWYHIVENHDDIASHFHDVLETVENLQFITRGNRGTLKATRNLARARWLVVVYRALSKADRFVITGYILQTKPKGEIILRRQ